jgi:hypothetical protein
MRDLLEKQGFHGEFATKTLFLPMVAMDPGLIEAF